MTLQQKKERLRFNNAEVNHRDRVGLLGDILIQNKPDAESFLEATGGMKSVYAEIGRLASEFETEFLLELFGERIPHKKDASSWRRYMWGAVTRQYALWCADQEVKRHHSRIRENEQSSAIRKLMADEFGDRFEA